MGVALIVEPGQIRPTPEKSLFKFWSLHFAYKLYNVPTSKVVLEINWAEISEIISKAIGITGFIRTVKPVDELASVAWIKPKVIRLEPAVIFEKV